MGLTPVTVHRFSRGRLSAISAVTVSPVRKHLSLYFNISRENIRADDAAGFLRELLRMIPGHLIVVWDNCNTHRAKVVKDLERSRPRLHLEYLPPYAPELNPDEGVWSQLKCNLANGRPDDLDELEGHLLCSLADIAASQSKLRACVHGLQLPLF